MKYKFSKSEISRINDIDLSMDIGLDNTADLSTAPMGIGPVAEAAKIDTEKDGEGKNLVLVTNNRGSSSTYDFQMTFNYEFSTSSDPNLAGHASDVIVGGGIAGTSCATRVNYLK